MKKRAWTGVLYDDSANPKWRELIEETHLQYCYVYHDKDINPDGTKKEPHYHIMWSYDGPQTQKQAEEIGKLIGVKNGIVQPVNSIKGMYRYFTHKDNPEKYQYKEAIIKIGNGFEIDSINELTTKEIKEIKKELQHFIKDNDIYEYSDFMDCVEDNDDWYQVASTSTMFFDKYITSRRNKKRRLEYGKE